MFLFGGVPSLFVGKGSSSLTALLGFSSLSDVLRATGEGSGT
jgi:hypothetical protein